VQVSSLRREADAFINVGTWEYATYRVELINNSSKQWPCSLLHWSRESS